MVNFIPRLLQCCARTFATLFTGGVILLFILYLYMQFHLPNVEVLKDIHLQVPLKILSKDGELIAEFGEKRRIPVPFEKIPPLLVHAVLATEDQRFFEHSGVDPIGLLRAAIELAASGTKSQGGSTITMQVARNFFLTRKKTYTRKINEILLAIKIDKELSKEKILNLYMNKIYLGNRAYGVAAAARVYFGKNLDELTLPEIAMIAGLPKAPSNLNPLSNPSQALKRRNHVLERMWECGYIDKPTYLKAQNTPIVASYHGMKSKVSAPYVAEMVRQAVVSKFGVKAYTMGLKVYTTIDSRAQLAANTAVRDTLLAYDRRHGYRGVKHHIDMNDYNAPLKWALLKKELYPVNDLLPALVTHVGRHSIDAQLEDDSVITIPWETLSWARKKVGQDGFGPKPKMAGDIVRLGDVIRVMQVKDTAGNITWALSQIPEVQGALIAANPEDGAILALTGGFDFQLSKFNRITQSDRQAGSAFKPFVYAAALNKGYTMATIINDAPVVFNDPAEEDLWRPQNHTREFYGPTRLRVGLVKSRNLVSIRLLEQLGIPEVIRFVARFGFDPKALPNSLTLALGTQTVTPLQLTRGFCVFANGGYRINPYYVESMKNAKDEIIYTAQPPTACEACGRLVPAPRVIPEDIAYLITSAMQDVITSGTGRRAQSLNRQDLAGKTGTTNEMRDGWFAGYNRDLVAVSWMGFDQPRTLHEFAARTALPLWIQFMGMTLEGKPERNQPRPPGLVTLRIDAQTGLPATEQNKNTLFETFRSSNAPNPENAWAGGNGAPEADSDFASPNDIF